MKQITNFMSDIADEFKIVVVEAIRSLCLKFPLKYRSLINFLSNILREKGGFDYKKAIVDSIVIFIRDIPDAKGSGLLHLCEFIEDCEFTYLSTQEKQKYLAHSTQLDYVEKIDKSVEFPLELDLQSYTSSSHNSAILIDSVPLKELDIRWLRESIGYVGQEPHLFNMDIKSNIRLDVTSAQLLVTDNDFRDSDFRKQLTEIETSLLALKFVQSAIGKLHMRPI